MYHDIKTPSIIRKKITVKSFAGGLLKNSTENLDDLSRSVLSYNFDYSTGELKRGAGMKKIDGFNVSALSKVSILGVYYYKRYSHEKGKRIENIIFYCSDKCLYLANMTDKVFSKLSNVTFNEKPTAVQYNYLDNDVMLFASKSGELYYLDDINLYKIDGAPAITSLCVHKERLFVTVDGEGTSLWFSDDFDPTNWIVSLTEAGFIDFKDEYGKLLKVVSFLDYVYVFREYGISRVIAYGEQEEFSTDNLFGKQGKIIGSSVTDCGDFIIMLTSSGIYKFNGLDTVKILPEYDKLFIGLNNDDAKGLYVGNCFYLNFNVLINGVIRKVLLVYDVVKKTSHLANGLDINDMVFSGGDYNKFICIRKNDINPYILTSDGCINGSSIIKYHETPKTNFGITSKLKRLSKVSLYTSEDMSLKIDCNSNRYSFDVKGGGYRCFYPCLSGETFKFIFVSESTKPVIHDFCVTVDYFKER